MEERAKSRLLQLAKHLETLEEYEVNNHYDVWIEWPQFHCDIWYAVKYNPSFFKQMSNWFEEWDTNEDFDEPELIENRDLGFAGSCLQYFNLTPKDFTHLFDMRGYQNIEKYGGESLNLTSCPKSIAFNISAFLKRK